MSALHQEPPQMLTAAALTERGWTKTLVDRLLGQPDELKRNPIYRNAAPMRLYHIDRVQQVEASIEFITAKAAAAKRKSAAIYAAQMRQIAVMTLIEMIPLPVKVLPLDKVRRSAIEAYNSRNLESTIGTDTPEHVIRRIMVNFIRHSLAHYDELLASVTGFPGVDAVRQRIRVRTLEAIAKAYPGLASECERQEFAS